MASDKTILLGLTTSPASDWRDKIEEIKEFKLTEISLFLEGLSQSDRQELFALLATTSLQSIPCVHLANDFTAAEIEQLISKYKSKIFTCHADQAGYELLNRLPKYNSLIYMENPEDAKLLADFSLAALTTHQVTGLCLDLSHAASIAKTNNAKFKTLLEIAKKLPVGVNHVSGVRSRTIFKFIQQSKSHHQIESLTEFDYLKDLPTSLFSKYICLELDNSLLEQREVKQYLELILEEKAK